MGSVQKRKKPTFDDLCDAAWDAVPIAFVSFATMLIGSVFYIVFLYQPFEIEREDHGIVLFSAVTAVWLLCLMAGVAGMAHWGRCIDALQEYKRCAALEAEKPR